MMMRWLEGKLPVPKVIAYEKDEATGLQYLLMSRVTGKMSCDDYYMSRPKELCELLAQALKLLWSVRPEREPVLSHGDFCLPNIFIEDGKLSGLIDLGDTGVNDKWLDIALCYRSLKHNADGTWGEKIYQDFNPELLFVALGIEPDWKKIRYYILLDELF